MPFTHFWADKINDLFFAENGVTSLSSPVATGPYVAFTLDVPDATGAGTELGAAGGYVRQQILNTTPIMGHSALSVSTSEADLSWGVASADYSNPILGVVIANHVSTPLGGSVNVAYHSVSSKTVTQNDTAKILTGQLKLTMS